MENKLFGAVLGVTVGILLIGSMLMPIIVDADEDTKVYYNNNFGPYAGVGENQLVEITATAEVGNGSGGTMTVNGVPVTIPQGGRAILLSDNVQLVHNYTYGLSYSGIDQNGAYFNYNLIEINLSIENGVMTVTGTDASSASMSNTVTYEWCYYRNNSGDYRLVDYIATNQTVYINDVSQVKAAGYVNTPRAFYSVTGTDVKIVNQNGTVTNTTATVELMDVMEGVKSFTLSPTREDAHAFEFVIDNAGESQPISPYYFVIPASVYGQTESNAAYSGILYAIPIVLILALILTIVATYSRFNN